MADAIGCPFPLVEQRVEDVLAGLGPFTAAVNDPPWTALHARVAPPRHVVLSGDMERSTLEALVAAEPDDTQVVVGIGGGTALDTAKYLAWRTGKRLVQVPTITSVDAGFTDAVGLRDGGRVRYVGRIEPEVVVLDVELVRSAPKHLNRAGIGDVLSCHTGLFDWRLASGRGEGVPWRDDLAALAHRLLGDLHAAAADVAAVSADGVRFLAGAYRQIGAACVEAGHSRFEEGSEHFWAYAYEHVSGAHLVHGELVSLGVVALSVVQGNAPDAVADVVARCGTRAHPADLGIAEDVFGEALLGLRGYARAEGLDVGIADVVDIDQHTVDAAWSAVCALPRVVGDL